MSIESDLRDISEICHPGRSWWLRIPPKPLSQRARKALTAVYESAGVTSVDPSIEEWFTYMNPRARNTDGPYIPIHGSLPDRSVESHGWTKGLWDEWTVDASVVAEDGREYGEFTKFSEAEKASPNMAGLHIGHFINLGNSYSAQYTVACFATERAWLCHFEKSARHTRMNQGPEMQLADPLPGPTVPMWLGGLAEALRKGRLVYNATYNVYMHPDDDGGGHPDSEYPWGWQPGDPYQQ